MFTSKYRHVTKGMAIITALGRVTWKRDDKSVRHSTFTPALDFFVCFVFATTHVPHSNSFAHYAFHRTRLRSRFTQQFLHQSPRNGRQTVMLYI